MPFLDHTHNQPVTAVRDLAYDEEYLVTRYEAHAANCTRCVDALDTFRDGQSLCDRGNGYAKDVADYIFSKHGKAYSVVDKEQNREVLVSIPREYKAARRLLRAIEDGLLLRRKQQQQHPIISYDRTYHVPTRGEPESVTQIIERTPRHHVIVYRRSSPSRNSPSRGSLYETDRQERRQYVRVLR